MRAKWPLLATFLALGAAYIAYPYATLYRLDLAMKSADAATLSTLVDWPAVREGIKEDVCDLGLGQAPVKAGESLPPFGASFVRGIASNTIDQTVTPQGLVAATSVSTAEPSRPAGRGGEVQVGWAFFDSPTSFTVTLHIAGQPSPVKLQMDLRDSAWRIDRVWLPPEMLSNNGSRT